jgi:predicted DsbA family dithiol-disulfide isomerase
MDGPITIDVWSDIACPWCYIGKRRLEEALAAFAERPAAPPVTVDYHSFELAPDSPVDFEGGEIDFLVGHKGMPEADVARMLDHVTGVARSAGLGFDFDRVRHTNTVKAHQLLHHARAEGLQTEAVERLMSAYFTEGRHLGLDDELAAIAAELGLDPAEALRALRDEDHLGAVRADQRRARELGVTGVPFYVIDGRYGLSGAQPAETFLAALDRVVADRGAAVA